MQVVDTGSNPVIGPDDIQLAGKCLAITDIIRSIHAKAHVMGVLTWWNHKAALADA